MTPDAQAIFESWSAPVGVNVALCLAALVYSIGWVRLHVAFRNLISAWRLAAFLAGIVSLWIAIGSPVEAFDDVSLTVHMVQHLLLMAIAPPLILLGAPTLPLLQGLPQMDGSQHRRPISPMGLGETVRTPYHPSCDLLARRRACLDRMAYSRGV